MSGRPAGGRVTLGVPVYNGERYLEETLRSLLAQDLADVVVVVSDNGSTDATEQLCRDIVAGDGRVRYVRSEANRGAAWNYNRVLEMASTPYFKWAAADDLCAPTFVSRCVAELEAGGPDVVIAYAGTTLIDELGTVVGPLDDDDLALPDDDPVRRLDRLLRHRVEWHPVFGVMRTDVLRTTRAIGAFPLADVALLAEMALRGKFVQVPERLFLRRYHQERSIVAGPSFVEQAAWYDPGRRLTFAMPQTRLTRELVGGVVRAPLTTHERTRACQVVIRRWAMPHWRHIGGEVKLALRGGRPSVSVDAGR